MRQNRVKNSIKHKIDMEKMYKTLRVYFHTLTGIVNFSWSWLAIIFRCFLDWNALGRSCKQLKVYDFQGKYENNIKVSSYWKSSQSSSWHRVDGIWEKRWRTNIKKSWNAARCLLSFDDLMLDWRKMTAETKTLTDSTWLFVVLFT